ncbi:MAG: glutamine--fructose-6-phosphate aminotransferase [bacterium]|nr:MAG: glutamine--fructose-6-phosphate aminotransferase [bacterium]
MCGISGIVSSRNVSKKLLGSIQNLEYRGYDSCGMAVLNEQNAQVKKNVGYVADVAEKELFTTLDGNVGIAHTRWATHGGVTQANAHPHVSCSGRLAIVHNGIISNYRELKAVLRKKKHRFASETDSEVIAHLIEERLKGKKNSSIENAFMAALMELDGSYAVAMITIDKPGIIYCGKYESPLIIGLGKDENYVGSDFNAFIEYTKDTIIMDDGECAIISSDGYEVKKVNGARSVPKKITTLEWDAEMAKKGGFPHYMLKEIHEQPDSIKKVMAVNEKDYAELAENLISAENAYLTGVGTTFYVSQLGQYCLASEAGIMAPAVSSDEFLEIAPAKKGDFVLAVSQSGETYDTLRALRAAKKAGPKTAAIVNVVGSSMSRLTDKVVLQGSGPEICVISTKAAVSQMIALMRLAIETGALTGHLNVASKKRRINELKKLPKLISDFLNERSAFVRSLAQKHAHHFDWLFIGRGKYYPIALEAALKVKEVAYLHAEGMPAGFLKHGTIALIDDRVRTLVFIPSEKEKELFKLTMGSVEEIMARGGKVVAFHSSRSLTKSKFFKDELVLPDAPDYVAPILSLVAAQLFSYFIAIELNRNIDKPRALAKSVTVA